MDNAGNSSDAKKIMAKMIIMVPCYNCEQQAVRVAKALDQVLDSGAVTQPVIEKILFVDNRSTDRTVAALQETLPSLSNPNRFQIVQNEKNYGLGGSHKSVFTYALDHGIEFVAVLHGDNQADASELPKLVQVSNAAGGATVLGSRFSKTSRLKNYAASRSWGNLALNRVYSLILGRAVEDLGSGLNLFNMNAFRDRRFLNFDDHFTFNMDVLIHLFSSASPVVFLPISWKAEDEVSNAVPLKVGARALAKILTWAVRRERIWKPTVHVAYRFSVLHDG